MLVLPIHTHGDVLALDDDAAPGRLAVALARPRLARRSDGSSSLRLVRWTTQSSATVATGGRLTLDVEVEAKAEDLDKAGLTGRGTQPLSWLDAKIRLEGPEFETVEAEVSKAIGTAAAVSVDLTNLAAGVLAPLLQGHTVSPLQITWIGHVLLRLPPVAVIASADVKEIRRRMDLVEPGRRLTVIRSIIDANARVEIRGAGNLALEQALRDWVLGELNARLDAGRSLDVRASASEVVHWPIQLATTLDDSVPPTARGSIVETIILDSGELGRVLPVDVRVLADFTGSLERVDVRLRPAASEQIVELAFSSDAPQPARLGTPDFRWSHRVKLKERPSGPWGAWQDVHNATAVTIPVSAPARLNVEVMAAGLDFAERWQAVRVVLTHAAPEGPSQSHTIELTGAQTSARWTAPLEGSRVPLKAQVIYVARQGQSVERVIDHVVGDQVIVTDPLDGNCVPFSLLPVGTGWSEVSLAMVDLRYVDGAYGVDETIELRTLLDFVEWSVPARPDGPQTVQWRLHASFADGRFTSGAWQTAERGAIIVRIDGVPRRTVQVFPIYFDPAVSKSATLRLRSGSQVETLVFTDRTQRNVTLDPGPFSWTIQWTKPDGTPLNESAPQDGHDVLVVPPFRPNQA